MSYAPVANIIFNYDELPSHWLKFYKPGTTTPIAMATDITGDTTLAKAQLNLDGFPTTDGTTLFIPFLNQSYDGYLFPTAAEADANDTINARRVANNINPFNTITQVTKEAVPIIEGQTVYTLANESGGSNAVFVDGRSMIQSSYKIIGTTLTLDESLFTGQTLEVWSSLTVPSENTADAAIGTKGNPYIFTDCATFVNNIPYVGVFKSDDWVQVSGRTVENDGGYAVYQVTTTAPTIRRNYENYIPLDVDGDGASLWAVLVDGFKRNFDEQPIEIIAHRSFNHIGIQNTAFNDGAAVQYDVQSLETDIQVPLDATTGADLVRYHDTVVESEMNGNTGAISSLTVAQIEALTFKALTGNIYESRIKIAKFADFVVYAKSVGARIYPEIKAYRTIADIQLMIDVIEDNDYASMTIMQSFNIDDLVEVRRINKRVGVGWLTTNIFTAQEDIDFDKLQKLKWSDVLLQEGNAVLFPSIVEKIYDAGIGCAIWGLEDNAEIRAGLNVGVYRQMLDQPQLIASVRGLQNVNF